jgi:dihydroorotate dehydrogenase (NAD+) catalytic subunit
MLNSIGLENPGLEVFLKEKMPFLKKAGVPIIVSIASQKDPREFILLANKLDKIKDVAAIELNISCPNIRGTRDEERGTNLISQDAAATYDLVKAVRKATNKTIITKLSPNVTSIIEIAEVAEKAGSDAVSLINTITGLSVDVETRKPKIAAVIGGLSGPAIRPIALRMVWEVYQRIKIPIIGMGGIMDTNSALEFFICGATAVAIGTANFINPKVSQEIIKGIEEYLRGQKINDINNLIGSLKCKN